MPAHRFSHLLNSTPADAAPWPLPASPFASVPLTLATSPAAAVIYEAALEAARKQLVRRSVLFTWNARQN
ncbi:MAG TPA: hypothetical protein VFG20_01775 [Planctomycetaceae bacterium]|nr:hypothetical protein [Planctomycetaceae bacterium]